jgi:hypothetical protein
MREYNKEMKICAQQLACDSQTPDNPSSVVVEPELTLLSSFSDSTRTGRGLSHDLTGLLLCPVEYDWEIPEYAVIGLPLRTDTESLHGTEFALLYEL